MSRLDEIRQRVEATWHGPWAWFGNRATDQIFLGTQHSGRQILLAAHTNTQEIVYDHGAAEAYTLEEARALLDEKVQNPDTRESLRHFLDGPLDQEEGSRSFYGPLSGDLLFTRYLKTRPDLHFQDHDRHVMVSYRDTARFEVLNGMTEAENAKLDKPHDLYREDIVGIDNPEAELIANSRDDLDFLLSMVRTAVEWIESDAPTDERLAKALEVLRGE